MSVLLDNGGLIADPLKMIERTEWGARARRDSPQSRGGGYDGLVLHHTAGVLGFNRFISDGLLLEVQDFHQNHRGWTDIAYNFGVDYEGSFYELRGFNFQNGANGNSNDRTLSIVYLGNTEFHEFTPAARAVVVKLGEYLESPASACPGSCGLWGHRDVDPTVCPGAKAYAWLQAGGTLPDC